MPYTCYHCFQEKPNNGTCPFCGYDPSRDKEKYPLALPEGTILGGRYIVGRVLGEGGFGITYVAQEYATKRLVAIKEYLPGEMATRSCSYEVTAYSGQRMTDFAYGKDCFLEEARTLAEFQKEEHIVSIYSFFEENGTAYFAMEYVDGISLQQYMRERGGRLSPEEANRLLRPVMEAVGKIHRKGIVHRDISPDNILITEGGKAKLIDFGAARYSIGQKSMSLDVVLKHGFAPIEQYSRRSRQGPFTDVYAMAATYYYAITGKLPPDAIDRMTDDQLQLPHALGIKIKKNQENALKKGLAVKAEDRWQSMHEFADALCPQQTRNEQLYRKEAPARKKATEEEQPAREKTPKKRTGLKAVALIAVLGLVLAFLTVKVILPEIKKAKLRKEWTQLETGSLITFGSYEQDNDISNGKEAIEWIVLNKKDNKALLLSRYALDCQQFNSDRRNTAWENCTLRNWMNESFFQDAFTSEEQTAIITNGLENAEDKVFLLSTVEAEKYLSSDDERLCEPTAFTIAKGVNLNDRGSCWWWLRSQGDYGASAADVTAKGKLNISNVDARGAVRPAFWIDLNIAASVAGDPVKMSADTRKTEEKTEDKDFSVQVGSIVTFGSYEQDNNTSNGKEVIEWRVLDIQNNKALLISRYALDRQPYNDQFTDVTWETSSLRAWLNDSFLNDAFNAGEQGMISALTVNADKNPRYNIDPGSATKDQIFLISFAEAEEFFDSDNSRRCVPTEYAIAKGAYTNSNYEVNGKATCYWWLRTSGNYSTSAVRVNHDGSVHDSGIPVSNGYAAVRPALWVDLEAIEKEISSADTLNSAPETVNVETETTDQFYLNTRQEALDSGMQLKADTGKLLVAVKGQKLEVVVTGIDIRDSYLTNQEGYKDGLEYGWLVRFSDGVSEYDVSTTCWRFNPGKNEERTIDSMQHSFWIDGKNTANAEMSHTANEIQWSVEIPDGYSINFNSVGSFNVSIVYEGKTTEEYTAEAIA